jgi:tetratricopeptide (TPR) repeat protein
MTPRNAAILVVAFLCASPIHAAPTPDDAKVEFRRATAAVKAGRFDEAVEAYARAEALATSKGSKAAAANGGGHVFMKLRRYAEAIPHFERAVATDPGYKLAWSNLGVCHLRRYEAGLSGTESLDAALIALRTAAALDPAFHPESLRAAQDDAARELACAALSATLADASATTAVTSGPPGGTPETPAGPGAPALDTSFTGCRKAGEAAEAACQWDLARANYARAESLATTKRSACAAANFLGLLALRTRHPAEAVDHLRRATVADPANKYAWNNLGVALMRLYDGGTGGKELIEQAVDAFQRVAVLDAAYKPDNLAWSRSILTELGGPTLSATAAQDSGTAAADSGPPPVRTPPSP